MFSGTKQGGASGRARKDVAANARLFRRNDRAEGRRGNHLEGKVWQEPVYTRLVFTDAQKVIHDNPGILHDALDLSPMFHAGSLVSIVLAFEAVRKIPARA